MLILPKINLNLFLYFCSMILLLSRTSGSRSIAITLQALFFSNIALLWPPSPNVASTYKQFLFTQRKFMASFIKTGVCDKEFLFLDSVKKLKDHFEIIHIHGNNHFSKLDTGLPIILEITLLNKKYASGIVINAKGFGGGQPRYYYPGLPRNYFISLNINI